MIRKVPIQKMNDISTDIPPVKWIVEDAHIAYPKATGLQKEVQYAVNRSRSRINSLRMRHSNVIRDLAIALILMGSIAFGVSAVIMPGSVFLTFKDATDSAVIRGVNNFGMLADVSNSMRDIVWRKGDSTLFENLAELVNMPAVDNFANTVDASLDAAYTQYNCFINWLITAENGCIANMSDK